MTIFLILAPYGAYALLMLAATLGLIAAADVPWQLYQHTRQLRMSRTELARVRRLPPNVGGRPPALSDDLRARIARMRAGGMSLGAIADQLTAEEVPTAHGGVLWWPSAVQATLRRVGAR